MGITAVSINCGAGATDMGFERAGFDIVGALCMRDTEAITYQSWSSRKPIVIRDVEIVNTSLEGLPGADVAICNINRIKFYSKVSFIWKSHEWEAFRRYVNYHRPKTFMVFGPKKMNNTSVARGITVDLQYRYNVGFDLYNAVDYLTAQDRHVAVFVGVRLDARDDSILDKPCLGEFISPEPSKTRLSMGDVLDGIPMPRQGDVCMKAFSRAYLRKDRRRDMDDPSLPIPVCGGNMPLYPGSPRMVEQADGSWLPGPNGTSRRLSWQEAAAIQGFPAGMEFHGGLQSKYAQIGRSVPVRFAEAMARQLGEMFIRCVI